MDVTGNSKGEVKVSSDWKLLLERGLTMGLDLVRRSS